VVLALAGCKSNEQKLIDAHRGQLVAQLDKLKALAPVVEKQPHLETAQWPVAGVKVGEGGTAQLIFANKLGHACGFMMPTYAPDNTGGDYVSLTYVDRSANWFEKVVCGVEGNEDLMGGLMQQDVDTLLAMKHVLVVRPTVKQVPQVARDEAKASVDSYLATGKGKDIEHFEPGRLAGDALLYELATGKLVGNFPFDVRSNATVEVERANYNNLVFDLNKQLDAAIQKQLQPQ